MQKGHGEGMRLNYKRTILAGLAFLSISAFWQLYDNNIPLMLKNTFGMGEKLSGVIMAMDNVLALFLLPYIGLLSDKVKTPIGKRMPFILLGTLGAVIFMTLIPIADMQGNLVLFLVALGLVLISMSLYRSPAVALMPDITPKPLRSMANAIINLMGAIGGVYTLLMVKIFVSDEMTSYMPLFLSVAILMVVSVTILFLTIKENKLSLSNNPEYGDEVREEDSQQGETGAKMPKDVRKSYYFILASIFLWFTAYNAVTTAFSRYVQEVWGLAKGGYANSLMIATIAAILSYIPVGKFASKVGRKKTIIAGIILMTLSYLAGFLMVEYSPMIYLVFALTGIGWASINVNSYPMIVEMSKSTDIGKYTGVYYTFSMTAQIVTPILSGIFLEISYRTLFPYAFIFSIASLCTMLLVKHGDSKPMPKASAIENFDVDN